MNIISKSALVILFFTFHQNTYAEDFLTMLSDNNFEIRKSFTGSAKDTASPASFIVSGGSGIDTYHNIDLAIKISEHEYKFDRRSKWHGRVYPSIEFHKNSDVQNEADNTQAALSFEFERVTVHQGPIDRQL